MTATPEQLDELSSRLFAHGVAAFCPTTLSCSKPELAEVCKRLGTWTRHQNSHAKQALSLGLHLEGPFINPKACGAHPPGVLREATLEELESLWKLSQQTIKIITLAPEVHSKKNLKAISVWAKKRKIVLSLGHSRASETEAQDAFQLGFRNITHAWNALPFHQRTVGALGAAIGNPNVYLEIIPDQVHVNPKIILWTQKLHDKDHICFVSDCISVAQTKSGSLSHFGPLNVTLMNGAGRLIIDHKVTDSLAGGGLLLPEMMLNWLKYLNSQGKALSPKEIRNELRQTCQTPLKSLNLAPDKIRKITRRVKIKWWLDAKKKIRMSCSNQ